MRAGPRLDGNPKEVGKKWRKLHEWGESVEGGSSTFLVLRGLEGEKRKGGTRTHWGPAARCVKMTKAAFPEGVVLGTLIATFHDATRLGGTPRSGTDSLPTSSKTYPPQYSVPHA